MSRGAALRPALLGLLALAPARGASGQAPSERLALDRLQDSLSAIHDTALLRSRQSALRRAAEARDPAATLRLALVSLRLARLGASAGASDAIDAARRVGRDHPEWPWSWYAWGLAETQRSAWQQANRLALGSRVGVGTLERAAERYRRALAADPAFAPAAVRLADLTLALRDTALFPSARDALRAAAATPAPPPDVLLGLGRVERATAELDSAERAFGRYLWDGGDRALGLLELARTRLARGDPEGEGPYYEGAASDDSAAVAGYRADLEPIAADSELAAFDRSRGAARAAFLRRFWTDRDLLELRAEGERLREHFRRLFHARRNFALTVSRRFYGAADAYRSGGLELDDRGAIYVRHGEPTERLRPFVYGLMPNESWRFARAEGDLLFHFSAGYDQTSGGDLYDYRLVESVLDLRGAGGAPYDQLLLSRQVLSPLYGRMLTWGRYGAQAARDQERGIGAASIAFGTSTDSYELQFARPLAVAADLVAVGRDAAGPVAQLVFAVGEDNLPAAPAADDGVGYPVRVRIVAIDGRGRPFGARDTTYHFHLARPLGPGEYLIQRLQVPLPPGRWDWRAAIQVGDSAGVVLPHDSVRVPASGPRLALSDLALGVPEASARWPAVPGDTVLLTPFDLFREGAEVELYYEAAGAEPGGSYRHEIAVYRVKRGDGVPERRPAVTLGFDERADGATVRAHRTLQLARLRPGRYLVEVRLRGPDGATDTRRRLFRIVGPH
jgi:GWxTD domain-containing protein